jgi:BASS family bile acid:Na+ symporter
MSQVLLTGSRLSVLGFLLSSMLGVGLSLTVQEIVAPLRNARMVLAALAGNLIIVPLVALATAKVFRLDEPFTIALLLLGLAPGAPFLPKLVELVKGDLAFSVALMSLLMGGSVIFLPLILPVLLPEVEVGIWQIARPLLLLMVLPLVAGLMFRRYFGAAVGAWRSGLNRFSNIALLTAVLLLLALNLPSVLHVFGTGAIAAAVVFTAAAGLTGHILGGPDAAARKVMALGTGFRNIAAAMAVAEEDFHDPRVMVMLVIAAFTGLLLLVPAKLPSATFRLNHLSRRQLKLK